MRMEGEGKRSKGGFFQLFDWDGKSRKKLFSNNSEVQEQSNQGKENVESMSRLGLQVIDVGNRRANLSNNGSSDFSCALSVTSDDGYGTRAPGVVARLMGLDSLPTSSVVEPSSTPSFDPSLLRGSQYEKSIPKLLSEYSATGYPNISNKQNEYSWNSVEPRLHTVQNRPIERFQRESLPPKSAKPIPITHHKLLSPIKSPGFIPTRNAANLMEAAAKIIEASPKTTTNGKVPSIGSSSVPLRIRDLKQKLEAAHTASRPPKSNLCAAKIMKGQHRNKSQGRSGGTSSSKASVSSEKGTSESLEKKGKSVSMAAQAKANVHRREGPMARGNSTMKQKTLNEVKLNHSLKSQSITQRNTEKRTSESRTNNVLRQNNQKQNCASNKHSSTSKLSVPNKQGTKAQSTSGSLRPTRTPSKVVAETENVSRKMGLVVTDSEKERANNLSQKKQSVNGDLKVEKSVSDSASLDNKSVKRKVTVDGLVDMVKDNRNSGMDVVSFTFTSPMKRTTPHPQTSTQVVEKGSNAAADSFGSADNNLITSLTFSFPGLNVIRGDALGVLLEQKLRELTNKVESSHCNVNRDDTSTCSTSTLHNSMPKTNIVSDTSMTHERKFHVIVDNDKSDHQECFDCFYVEDSQRVENQKRQQPQETEVHSNGCNGSETGEELECQLSSPVSSFEPSFTSGCHSSSTGSKHCSPAHAQEMFDWISASESLEAEAEPEFSDTASSISVDRNLVTGSLIKAEFKLSSNWQLDYVRDVLRNAELQLKDFALDQAPTFITPNLFDELENQGNGMERSDEEHSKLERKLIFDCVSECMNSMSGQISVGSFKAWDTLRTLFQRKGWLAEELHKEILGWKSMGDLMVDELVDKDMSTKYGRWLDFDIEAFEEGMLIENGILTSLVDELIFDLLLL